MNLSVLKFSLENNVAIVSINNPPINALSLQFLNEFLHKFEVVDANLPTRARHVAASRAIEDEEKMIADFNRALAAAHKDGSYAAIVAKWDKRYPLK